MEVVVTGMGIVSSIGNNVQEFKESLLKGCSGIEYTSDIMVPTHVCAGIKSFNEEDEFAKYSYIGNQEVLDRIKNSTRRTSKVIRTIVSTAFEAWVNADLHEVSLDPERMGLVIGGNNLTQGYAYDLYEEYQQNPSYLTPSYALSFMDTNYVGILSEIFDIRGEGFTLGAASASGNAAIIKGMQMLKSGDLDICMISAPYAQLSPMELQAFYNVGALGGEKYKDSPKLACRPFDKDHEGFIYGEASGTIILETLDSALARQAPIYGHVLGGSFQLDANRLANPSVEGEVRVMRKAMKQAGISTKSIDYINTHGSSSPLGDATELQAIRSVFEGQTPEIWLNSTKPLTGHCLYSAGLIESIASLIQLNHDFLHPLLNLNSPIETGFRFCAASSMDFELKTVMNNSFGFSGINTSIIFGKERLI
ncbi:beta-ketoacyl synthase N-terminal-like domain-containing protein [Saccharibacillus sacchari]|uniref:Beta-ketoacyl synthase N-terminal-like domain-containing protein n=1 Tax=Saccharibacillus sacchari TaxID=456493 RepID=A0ACC6PJH6_9BACL